MLAIYSIAGIGVVLFFEFEEESFLSSIFYVFVFILIPACSACGVWQQNKKTLIIPLLLFLSQSIRFIGGEYWFPYFPPISVGMPLGNFANGQGYLIDFFAIIMTIYLAWLLRGLAAPK